MMTYRSRRRWQLFTALLVVYVVSGFFVLPVVLKRQIEERLGAALERHVSIGRVRTNPFTLSLSLEHLEVATPDGAGSLFGWDQLFVNFDALSSLGGDWVCRAIALKGFHATVDVRPDGSTNFSDLIAKFSPDEPAPDKKRRAWRFGRIDVAAGRVQVIDRSRAESFTTVVGPIDFTLLDFRTAGERGAPYQFAARTESGEKFDWSGTLRAAPLASVGDWRVENLLLPKYAPYFEHLLPVILTGGKLTAEGKYEIDLTPAHRCEVLSGGRVRVDKLQCIDRGAGQPLLDLVELEVTGIAADGLAQSLSATALRLNGGRLQVQRRRDGGWNFLPENFVTSPAPAKNSAAAAARAVGAAPRPSVSVQEVALRDFEVNWNDATTSRPVEIALSRLNATMKNLSLAPGATMPLSVSFGCAPQGTVNVVGEVGLAPLQAELDLEAAWLPLANLSPYAENFVNGRVKRGSLSFKGHAGLTAGADGALTANLAGDSRLEDLALAGAGRDDDLLGLGELALHGIKFATAPRLSVVVDEVKVAAPFVRAKKAEDGRLDLLELIRQRAEVVAIGVSPPATATTEMVLNRVVVDRGEMTLVDESVKPSARLELKEISGQVRDWSSGAPERGEAELHATVAGAGAITIRGRFNPLAADPLADLQATADAVDLTPAAPYVGKFAGFELERGTLSWESVARLQQRQVAVHNKVTLDQFTLGPATGSPDAVKLPVRLGVALLKDARGKIVLELPIEGRLDDPQFSVGPVVGRVFTNLLTKAATSPFALLGSMFGGGGDELGVQEFGPGETNPTAESARRLATIERALLERPALRVELEGGYDAASDASALAATKLERLVRERVGEERRRRGAEPVPLDQMLVSNEERTATLEQLYLEKFFHRESAPAAATTNPPLVAQDAPPAPMVKKTPPIPPPEKHRGFFGKTLDVMTLKGVRERRAARKERARAEAAVVAPQASPAETAAPEPEKLPPLDEITGRLAQAMTTTPEELRELAEARARRVRERVLASGKIPAARVTLRHLDPAAAAKAGARVRLQLQ